MSNSFYFMIYSGCIKNLIEVSNGRDTTIMAYVTKPVLILHYFSVIVIRKIA
ncbi:conserved hypothetical protein [Treponema phagedenis]|uniref:Uncharacterized protein n=1 Tax=Treponema phagedenis TaxID=162 RepID=A0A0B7GUU8_TREPH|nr:hypothetical protein HMPREF9554_02504 [Treponema phagedenis F0421]CEM62434.1 conserved hypothetical protein [Treponema phagedenis]